MDNVVVEIYFLTLNQNTCIINGIGPAKKPDRTFSNGSKNSMTKSTGRLPSAITPPAEFDAMSTGS